MDFISIFTTILDGISWPSKIREALHHHSEKKWEECRREMFKGLSNPDYLEWQQEILETLYHGLEIATVYGRKYPAAIIKPSLGWKYPFTDLCKLTEVNLPRIQISKEQKTYVKMLGRSLKWPQIKGFALRRIHLNEQGRAGVIEAVTTNFLQNVITTHILEWELYQLYKKNPHRARDLDEKNILGHLPRRALYHNNRLGNTLFLSLQTRTL